MSSVSSGGVMGTWWGFAEADRVVLGIIVVLLAALAAVYTTMRILRTRRDRRAEGVVHARVAHARRDPS